MENVAFWFGENDDVEVDSENRAVVRHLSLGDLCATGNIQHTWYRFNAVPLVYALGLPLNDDWLRLLIVSSDYDLDDKKLTLFSLIDDKPELFDKIVEKFDIRELRNDVFSGRVSDDGDDDSVMIEALVGIGLTLPADVLAELKRPAAATNGYTEFRDNLPENIVERVHDLAHCQRAAAKMRSMADAAHGDIHWRSVGVRMATEIAIGLAAMDFPVLCVLTIVDQLLPWPHGVTMARKWDLLVVVKKGPEKFAKRKQNKGKCNQKQNEADAEADTSTRKRIMRR